jgi:hypothetical protein
VTPPNSTHSRCGIARRARQGRTSDGISHVSPVDGSDAVVHDDDVRALTIRQPFAELIVAGVKDVENRTWRTSHRGPLAIHAAATTRELDALGLDPGDYTLGAVIGVVDVLDVAPDDHDGWRWLLSNPRRLPAPVPARGGRALFHVDI